jgi:NhaA family Na+:H+ antiporter
MGSLAGIGFTVSTFTATLAYSSSVPRDIAKTSILASIAASVAVSFVYFWIIGWRKAKIKTPSLFVNALSTEMQYS